MLGQLQLKKTREGFIKPLLGLFMSLRLALILILSIVLGGTSQAYILPKFLISFIAFLVILQVLVKSQSLDLKAFLTLPMLFGTIFLILFVFYLIPLPQAIWTSVPLRDTVVNAQSLLGISSEWRPLSLTPEDTAMTVWNFLPPIAVAMIMMWDMGREELKNAIFSLLAFGLIAVIFGIMQFASNNAALHFYPVSNVGYPTASFSNTNHFSTFLVMLLPLALLKFYESWRRRKSYKKSAIFAVFLLTAIPMIILTDSLSGYMLMPIVIFLSLASLYKGSKFNIMILAGVVAVVGLFLLDFFVWGNYAQGLLKSLTNDGVLSRPEVYKNIWLNMKPLSLFGTGPGSFYNVYLSFQIDRGLSAKYLNAAHNDYLQVWLEMGLLGFITMLGFAVYSGVMYVLNVAHKANRLRTSAAISSIAVMLASLVDYPLRTIALCTLLTFFAILMGGVYRRPS